MRGLGKNKGMLHYARALQVAHEVAQSRPALSLGVIEAATFLFVFCISDLLCFALPCLDTHFRLRVSSLCPQLDLTDNQLSHFDVKTLVNAAYPER